MCAVQSRDYCSAIWISLPIKAKFPFVFHLLTVIFIERRARAWEQNARSFQHKTSIHGVDKCLYAYVIVLVAMCTLNKKWLILRLFLSVLFVCQVHGLWLDEKRNGITLRFLHTTVQMISLCLIFFLSLLFFLSPSRMRWLSIFIALFMECS